jgi:hypothetical protein
LPIPSKHLVLTVCFGHALRCASVLRLFCTAYLRSYSQTGPERAQARYRGVQVCCTSRTQVSFASKRCGPWVPGNWRTERATGMHVQRSSE